MHSYEVSPSWHMCKPGKGSDRVQTARRPHNYIQLHYKEYVLVIQKIMTKSICPVFNSCRRVPETKRHSSLFLHSSGSKFLVVMAACTPSVHVFLGRPLFLLTRGIQSIINFGILSSGILLTWSYHCSLFCSVISIISRFPFTPIISFKSSFFKSNENTNLMQHCAGFISAGSLYMFRAQAPIRSI